MIKSGDFRHVTYGLVKFSTKTTLSGSGGKSLVVLRPLRHLQTLRSVNLQFHTGHEPWSPPVGPVHHPDLHPDLHPLQTFSLFILRFFLCDSRPSTLVRPGWYNMNVTKAESESAVSATYVNT